MKHKFRIWDAEAEEFSYFELPPMRAKELNPWEMFTDLKDKNGKDIYSGDVMNFKADKSSPSGGHYCGTVGFHPENAKVVTWEEGRFRLGSFDLRTELKMYEVVGTIHDQLKGAKP